MMLNNCSIESRRRSSPSPLALPMAGTDCPPGSCTARILIVDDEAENIIVLKKLLTRAGYAVCLSLTDPRMVVRQFILTQPDLLLLDWHMEPLSGLEILQDLRNHVPPETMPPVLVLTGDTSHETRCEALAAGAADFLNKPLDASEVLLRIRNLLQLRMHQVRSHEENQRLEDKVQERTLQLERTVRELKELQQQVIQQERLRALGAMAAGVAHDFNNSLMVIRGYSEILLNKDSYSQNPPKLREALELMHTAACDATETVRRLRDFYRPFSKNEEERSPLHLDQLLRECVQLSRPKWHAETEARGADIEIRMELGDPPLIHASASEMREMLINLIFNAVDAMPHGGVLSLRTGLLDDRVYVDVEDSGVGMSEETRRRCLEPFFSTKGEAGTGLGLATSYGIVRRHEGTIQISSELGQGTMFRLQFPLLQELEENPVEESPIPAKNLRILVVDDQPTICAVMCHYLAEDHHTVVTAGSGSEALARFESERFDVVICDLAMPQMSGDQVIEAMRLQRPDQPVILLTAIGAPKLLASVSCDCVISKPASLRSLREAIRQVTHKPVTQMRAPRTPTADLQAAHAA